MLRRPIEILFAMMVIVFSVAWLDTDDAEAQGLLRRIRSRIESRIETPPPAAPQPAPPAVDPDPNAGTATAPAARRLRPLSPQPNRSPQPAPTDRGEYGGSILAPLPDGRTGSVANDVGSQASLGIDVLPASGPRGGVQVVRFREDSLADDAGLRNGDVIVDIDGTATPNIAAVAGKLSVMEPGQRIQASVLRGDQTLELSIPLISKRFTAARPEILPPAADPSPIPSSNRTSDLTDKRLGVRVSNADGKRGVVVTEVNPQTPAATAGIQAGDRIVSLDGLLVADVGSFRDRLTRVKDQDSISLRLVRDGGLVASDVQMGRGGAAVGVDPQQDSAGTEAAADPASTLQGLGSVLGGLLGGKVPATKPRKKDQSNLQENSNKDVMAFGDDEPVRQVGFEGKTNKPETPSAAEPSVGLADDPPSLDILELPKPSEIDPATPDSTGGPEASQKSAEALRREIRRLEAELRQLEQNNDKASGNDKAADDDQ